MNFGLKLKNKLLNCSDFANFEQQKFLGRSDFINSKKIYFSTNKVQLIKRRSLPNMKNKKISENLGPKSTLIDKVVFKSNFIILLAFVVVSI